MDGASLVRAYYRAIDRGAYGRLRDLLSEGFVHRRPDRSIEGREAFVSFMRDDRPATDTEHVVSTVYVAVEADRYAAEGHLRRPDESRWFGFVDTFELADGVISSLSTYTDVHRE